jgi:octaprenyl-diphosphate synthase
VKSPESVIGPQFVGETRITQDLARLAVIVLMDQDPARQNSEGTFDDAHVLIQHQMMDVGAIEQRAHRRNQHDIVGSNQFPQLSLSFVEPASRRREGFQPLMPLPRSPALSIVKGQDSPNWANVETSVAVIVPFESPASASIDQLVGLVAADMERVNATILSRTGSEVTMIPEVANHLISSGGKRLRPMLTLAMANLTGYSGDGHIKLAASVEFMHTATLLHDDVVDESELRRGKLSARMLWGNEASVLVGDFLLGQAFRMMVEVGSLQALDILSAAAATIAEGEVMQLAAAKNTATTEDEYLAVIRGKTAELFAAACEVGPVIAKRPKAEQTACRSVGMNLGIAFQLVDDVLDYGGKAAKLGKNIGDDFREGKITLPVVLAFRRGNDNERAFWVNALERGEIADGDLDHAIGLMTKHRALEDTINRAQHYGAMAVDALALFPASPMKTALEQVVAFCLARSH